jgi:serine/threonine protein kinase
VNILIRDDKHSQLADFGLAIVEEDAGARMTATSTNAGSISWMSPERFSESGHRRDATDDVYAYGCLMYTASSSRELP